MKSVINRLFSAVLTAAVLFTCCPCSAAAAEEDIVRSLGSVSESAVPEGMEQWNLSQEGYGIGAQGAWDKGLYGQGVRVALIDSGIYREHEDLQGITIETGYNVIDQSTDTTDNVGHGTIVAGIIAADSRNSLGIDGISDRVTLVPIKCFDSSLTNVKHVITGIYLAVDTYHCDVINLSLGVTTDQQALREAVDYAASKGVIVVSAVGNSGETDPSRVYYPAAYDSVIGVGSYGQDGAVSVFSHTNQSVFVTAPGEALISLGNTGADTYREVSGTSYAAAHVTALAAIAKCAAPDMTVEEFKELLRITSRDAGAPGYDTGYGYGMVSAAGLAAALGNLPLYTDIGSHWAQESIETCSELGLLSGTGDGKFSPDAAVNRAMAVTVLWRMEGMPQTGSSTFSDVAGDDWYAAAVAWASENGIVSGYGDNRFGPLDAVTREQLAAMLCRYAAYRGLNTSAKAPSGFADWDQVSPYARTSLSWAVENGIMRGKTADTLVPGGTATRAELATMLCSCLPLFS